MSTSTITPTTLDLDLRVLDADGRVAVVSSATPHVTVQYEPHGIHYGVNDPEGLAPAPYHGPNGIQTHGWTWDEKGTRLGRARSREDRTICAADFPELRRGLELELAELDARGEERTFGENLRRNTLHFALHGTYPKR